MPIDSKPEHIATPKSLRQIHRDHHLSCSAMRMDNGRYQARVAIADLRRQHTPTQSFLDLEVFDQASEAINYALSRGIAWVEDRCKTGDKPE